MLLQIAIVPSFLGMYLLYTNSHSTSQRITAVVYGTAIAVLFICSTTYHVFELLFRPKMQLVRLECR